MTGWNMPPGVNESDIPGNRPSDIEFENRVEALDADGTALALRYALRNLPAGAGEYRGYLDELLWLVENGLLEV